MVSSATDLGIPLTLITEAVFARCLSAQKDERVAAAKVLTGPEPNPRATTKRSSDDVEMALYASKIISYAQGFALMSAMAQGVGLDDQQRRRGPDVARRLHHPQRLPGQDQGGVRPQSKADEPAGRSVLCRRDRTRPRLAGGERAPRRSSTASRCRPSARRWRTSTATAPAGCRPTCCRLSATTSAPTPTNGWIGRAASSSTRTGRAAAAPRRRRRIRFEERSRVTYKVGPLELGTSQ